MKRSRSLPTLCVVQPKGHMWMTTLDLDWTFCIFQMSFEIVIVMHVVWTLTCRTQKVAFQTWFSCHGFQGWKWCHQAFQASSLVHGVIPLALRLNFLSPLHFVSPILHTRCILSLKCWKWNFSQIQILTQMLQSAFHHFVSFLISKIIICLL